MTSLPRNLQTVSRAPRSLVPAIRASLEARLERLLQRPVIASVVRPTPRVEVNRGLPDIFATLEREASAAAPAQGVAQKSPWRDDPNDGSCSVQIAIDYDDLWRGCEKEVLEAVVGTVEGFVTFLTEEQRRLLEKSPREFLALNPPPESAELLTFKKEMVGGSEQVFELTLVEGPKSPAHIRHVAIVPNLIPLERQLAALRTLEAATDDGPLAPLRVLIGLADAAILAPPRADVDVATGNDRLDEFQLGCVRKALNTPHFSVIKGPPGSGKTTVITSIIRRALERGERVLVVSPTHVAVDNVVEKLAPRRDTLGDDDLERRSLPVRFAARPKRLLEAAEAYWIGPKRQKRAGTLARRVQRRLSATLPLAAALYARIDDSIAGNAPITAAVAGVCDVICGTPIGILSFDAVKLADAGSFDLLIVDEVSKMTLPEFLAIAVKARRWVLVGDPEQLPPYNNCEENGTTLDDVLDPPLELVCSVGGLLERTKPELRNLLRLVVVSRAPELAAAAIRAHIAAVHLDNAPMVSAYEPDGRAGILVCTADDTAAAAALLSPARGRDRTHTDQPGSVRILVERGVRVPRPAFASGTRFVESRLRAPMLTFDTAFSVYHSQPWTARAGQKLTLVRFRNGLDKALPSTAALAALGVVGPAEVRLTLLDRIAERFAINAVSVYDWLTGIPTHHFDTSPLTELVDVVGPLAGLREAVQPFVGTLRKQYRMHPSLSLVPRALFYFGEALEDGAPGPAGCRVRLVQVRGGLEGEYNPKEAQAICEMLATLSASEAAQKRPPNILVITPYRAQERQLNESVDAARARGALEHVNVEICTLDRCQGREAEYVFISLVRSRATPFLDAPKRWNVALTRAMQGLFVFGDIDAYLDEARTARRAVKERPHLDRPHMSLLARILESYDRQIAGIPFPTFQRCIQ